MADIYINERFGRLFKTYRLKAGISTLKEFSDLMSTNGLYYDISNYTRWQNGERIPTDRKVILAMLRIFTYRNSVTDINECNLFLSAAKQSEITNTEILDNNINFTHSSFSKNVLPTPLQDFIGRESLLREVSWKLMSYNKICISGTPGIGKSSFTIYLANILQGIFKGDIFYYRADISFLDSIILDIATYYGVEVSNIKNVKDKIVYLTHLIQNRQIIIILDNIDNYEKIEPLLKNLEGYCKFILVSQFKPQLLNDSYNLVLTGFSEDEVILLAYHKFKTNKVVPIVKTN